MTGRSRRTAPTLLISLCTIALALYGGLLLIEPTQAAATDDGAPSITVVDQVPFVPADGVFSFTLATDFDPSSAGGRSDDRSDYELAVTIYGLVEDELDVDRTPLQPLNRLEPIPLDDVSQTDGGHLQLDIPVRSGPAANENERLLLPLPGVYPVTVELRGPDGPVAATRTNLIRQPSAPTPPADASATGNAVPGTPASPSVSVVLPVSIADGLTAADTVTLLNNHPDVPVTILLQEGVIGQLRTDPSLAAALVAAANGRPVLAATEVELDPSALAAIDQHDLYLATTRSTQADLVGLGFVVDEHAAVLDAPLTTTGLSVMAQLGVRHILGRSIARMGEEVGSGSGFVVEQPGSPGAAIRIVAVDEGLSAGLGDPHAIDGAHGILARLAVRSLGEASPAVVGGPLAGAKPETVHAFLLALSQPGAPNAVLLADVAAAARLPVRAAELPEQDLRPVADQLIEVQAKLRTYEGFYGGGQLSPADYQHQLLSTLTRTRNPDDRRRALLRLDTDLEADLDVIDLPVGQPVTLAARSAPIPLVVHNDATGPRSIMLRFESDKVMAVDDGQIIMIEPGTSSIDVELEALSLGVSPLKVSVWTPDGTTNLATNRFEVRSTAVPGLGSLAGLAAVIFLVAWWVADAKKRRQSAAGGA